MDLRNICSKVDVDSIRAKFPPLPQIKLPKSMSKLKSRKIFRSSREDISSVSQQSSSKRIPANSENIPPSGFINRTPTRISTISSLMDQTGSRKWKSHNDDDNENSYRSAGGIDDYPSPLSHRFEMRSSRPISPIRKTSFTQEFQGKSEQNVKMSFGEKLQKGYKDVTEFKLKHLFAKRTVVHADKIEITEYIHRFDEDRRRDERVQQKIDNDIADNYKFHFKVSQQKSEESYIDDSPPSSPQQNIKPEKKNPKTLSEQSGDESGMESSPPTRKAGIASTRFSRVRKYPLRMSLEDDGDDNDGDHDDGEIELDEEEVDAPAIKQNASSLHGTKQLKSPKKFTNSRQSSRMSVKGSRKFTNTFSKDRPPPPPSRTPLNMSLEEDYDDNDNDDDGTDDNNDLDVIEVATPKKIKPNTSTLYDIKKHKSPEKSTDLQQNPRNWKSIRERINKIKQKSEGGETNAVSEKKRRAPLSPQQSDENKAVPVKSDKPFDTIKQNFKRIQKSVRLPQQMSTQSGAESENDEACSEGKAKLSKSQQFTERLKRFRSIDNVNKNTEDNENNESPINKITNKLQDWRKSFRKKEDPHNMDNDYDATSPQKQEKPVGSLMKKLKHIRSRKRDSIDDPDDDEEGGETYKESLAARAKFQLEKGKVVASQMPQITMKKISETKKYFKKKQDNDGKNKTDKQQSEEEEIEDEQEKIPAKAVVKNILRPPPPIPRPYFHNSSEDEYDNDNDDVNNHKFIKKSLAESQLIAMPTATAVWTTKPILSDDMTDFDDDLPRVLLHQDNSDIFESTLIIAVTRPISHTTSPIITELPPDSAEESTPDTKADDWIPNQDMIATFLEMTSPSQRKLSKDSTNSRGHSRNHSIDSSSDDSWFKDIPKGPSTAVLNSVHENDEPWKIQKVNADENLYKTKSIDLFEMQKKQGGVLCAFEDFDDELKNTPVVKIEDENTQVVEMENAPTVRIDTTNVPLVATENCDNKNYESFRNIDNYERESSEELENPDDDNSSRVTKISANHRETKNEKLEYVDDEISSRDTNKSLNPENPEIEELENRSNDISSSVTKISAPPKESKSTELENPNDDHLKKNENIKQETDLKSQLFGNSRESLTEKNGKDVIDSGEESDDDEYFQESEDDQIEVDRPPSKTPSPPPSMSPTLPPLPQRKPSINQLFSRQSSLDLSSLDCLSLPSPTMPTTKPPIPPKRPTPTPPPPKIPDRNPPTTRISKPLVKTASLRLAYSEQVNPEDVGKVNKLISRFEPEGIKQRPKIIPRKPLITYESDEYSDEEDLLQLLPTKQKEKFRDVTPTNLPRIRKSYSIDSTDIPNNNGNTTMNLEIHKRKATSQLTLANSAHATTIPSISISSSCLDANANFSQPSSVYSSPLAFPSSLVGSAEVTPLTNRKNSEHLGTRRNRRSMARDDEHFYSFDSDEENSYYSLSSTSSNRYVVDL